MPKETVQHALVHASLATCRTLLELGRAARENGLHAALEEPLSILVDQGIDMRTAACLGMLAESGDASTIGDLLLPGAADRFLRQHGTQRTRAAIVEAVRTHLLRRLEAPVVAEPVVAAPESAAELRRWAEENGVAPALEKQAQVLGDRVDPGLIELAARGLAAPRVGELLAETGWRRTVPQSGAAILRTAAWRYLQDEARALRRGREAEEIERTLPEDPLLRGLSEKLLELRARVRRHVQPWAGPQPVLDFEADPPAFVADAEPRVFPPARGRLARVRIELSGWERVPLSWFCDCGLTACTHTLGAIDAILAFLADPAAEAARAPIVEELKRPSWSRALRALDKAREQRATKTDEDDVRVAWRLEQDFELSLSPLLQRRTKRGWSPGGRIAFRDLAPHLDKLGAADRRALEALVPGDLASAGAIPEHALAPRVPAALLALAGHPRVYFGNDSNPLEIRAAEVRLAVRDSTVGGVELQARLGDEPIGYEPLLRLLSRHRDGDHAVRIDPAAGRVTVVRVDDGIVEILEILHRHGAQFPEEAVPELLARTTVLEERLPVTIPASRKGEEVEPHADVVLRLEPLDGPGLKVDVLVRALPGATAYRPGEGPTEVAAADGPRRFWAKRRLSEEPARVNEVLETLPLRRELEDLPYTYLLDDNDEALDLLAFLRDQPNPRVSVEWPASRRRVLRTATAKDLRLKVEKAKDWFGVQGEAEIDGERIQLAVLLDAARQGRRWVEVREGVWLTIAEELSRRLDAIADQLASQRGRLTAGLAALPALEELGAEAGEFEAALEFRQTLERIRAADHLDPVLPEGLLASLRDYQVEGFRWLARLASWGAGACLADDMGLGKTVQGLALLLHRSAEGPALVVAPTSVCGAWLSEVSRFAPSLRTRMWRDLGEGRRDEVLSDLGPGDILVMSYGMLVRDAQRLDGIKFATLVLDEAQAVKNPSTQRAKAARRVDAGFRVALTGTPLENHLGELWSLFHVVFPGLLGSWERFRERFANPIERSGDDDRRRALSRILQPFLLRRTKSEVARELPARTEIVVPIELSAEERRLYEDARLAAIGRLQGIDGSNAAGVAPPEIRRFQILAAITRLRLCACHPRLYDESSELASSKLERLLEILEELRDEEHKALVFSQFTSHLALVREALDAAGVKYLYLDGQTPPEDRDALVRAWQAGEAETFLISLKAGGTGLTLTAADYVIHLDPWWNPAVEDQATDRAHRIGQDKPVTVLRLVSRKTIEESILGLHGQKRALVAGVLAGEGGPPVSTAELLDLLRADS